MKWSGPKKSASHNSAVPVFIDKCETGVVSDGGGQRGKEGRINVNSSVGVRRDMDERRSVPRQSYEFC